MICINRKNLNENQVEATDDMLFIETRDMFGTNSPYLGVLGSMLHENSLQATKLDDLGIPLVDIVISDSKVIH